jgi:hypothetical protein
MEKHVRYPLVDRKLPPGLRAHKNAFFHMEFEERVVEPPQKVVGGKHGSVGLIWKFGVTERFRRRRQRRPLDLGKNASEEIGVEFDLLGDPLLSLQLEREATGDPLYVARQHIVREKPHGGVAWRSG